MSTTFDKVADIIAETCDIPRENIKPESHAINDLEIDSLTMVEVVVAAEEKFGVSIPDDEVKNLKTVGDAVAFIERAQN